MEYQKSTDERFERVFDYMESHEAPRQKVFFDGQIYDAFELLVGLVQRAENDIAESVDALDVMKPVYNFKAQQEARAGCRRCTRSCSADQPPSMLLYPGTPV